jgi:hypothetical protein
MSIKKNLVQWTLAATLIAIPMDRLWEANGISPTRSRTAAGIAGILFGISLVEGMKQRKEWFPKFHL